MMNYILLHHKRNYFSLLQSCIQCESILFYDKKEDWAEFVNYCGIKISVVF